MLGIYVLILHVAQRASASGDWFINPGTCDIHSRFDDTFLTSVSTVTSYMQCASICYYDETCRALTMEGEEPNIECKTYYQDTNEYGLYLTSVQTQIIYREKRNTPGLPYSEKCTKLSLDPNGVCDKRSDKLYPDEYLFPGEYLCSDDGSYKALVQFDGHFLVRYLSDNSVVFATYVYTTSPAGYKLLMQTDGNLVVYDSNMSAKWASSQLGTPAYLIMRNDGKLAVYSSSGTVIWETA